MPFENLGPEEAEHIRLFIKYFVDESKKQRWKTMLSMKPEKWLGASAYDCNQPVNADVGTPIYDIVKKLDLNQYLDQKAYIFQIGHNARRGVYESTLRSALLSEKPELECVVSIIPGKLAISYGHSNEFRLCKRT